MQAAKLIVFLEHVSSLQKYWSGGFFPFFRAINTEKGIVSWRSAAHLFSSLEEKWFTHWQWRRKPRETERKRNREWKSNSNKQKGTNWSFLSKKTSTWRNQRNKDFCVLASHYIKWTIKSTMSPVIATKCR